MQAGFLGGDERLHRLDNVAAGKVVGVNLLDVHREAGLGRGDLSVDDHGVRHAAQAHADEVEEPDLGPRQARAHPDGEERKQEQDEQQQGTCRHEENNISHLFGHGKFSGRAGR